MEELSDVVTVPMEKSNFVQPFRMLFKQVLVTVTYIMSVMLKIICFRMGKIAHGT